MQRRYLRYGAVVVATLLLTGCSSPVPFPKLTYAERPCYRTLGSVDCHSDPLVAEKSRRIGSYDAPTAVELEVPWYQRIF